MTGGPLQRPPRADRRYRVDYAAELNPEQLRVVMHPGGPMLALAGAGTGKTRTLVYRACRLVEDGVPAPRVLLLTFTNKAAREMLDRVERITQSASGRVTGGTFHSVGHRILRRHASLVGYSDRFSILDREDAADLMGQALADLSPELPSRRTPRPRLLLDIYSLVINTGRDLEQALLDRAPQYFDQAEAIAAVYRRYLERKRQADAMDFDDLLLNWLLLLTRQPAARRELVHRFEHILVDEYQDTNRLQADIVDGMLGPEKNVMVVGDDAQSIYGFRGAEFANIIGFPERHPECEIFRLETNYRSTPEVLRLANASISHNQHQFAKELRAVRPGGELPQLVSVPSPEAQAAWVADRLLALREEGVDLEEMAVLYRNHSHSLDLQVELTRRNIPYRVRSGVRFFEQRHIKDVLAHLRFVDNPRDEMAFVRMVKLRPGFGPRLAGRLWEMVAGADSLARTCSLEPAAAGLRGAARTAFGELQLLLQDLQGRELSAQPGEALRLVLDRFYRQWARENLENAGSRIEDLEQLALFADSHPDLNTFLAEVTLLNDLSGEDSIGGREDEMVTLSTAHQAKGLEWRAVFIIWLSEGRFPTVRAEDEEEERRLFYVAATRARDLLFLVQPRIARDRYRVDVVIDPSRFVSELPTEVFERVTVADARPPDGLDALPAGARYRLPSFFEDPPDDQAEEDEAN
ncbi:MAG TPA: ATP-dependent helicase [Thermoanaerobaculales bacterium]|nr:ATP-dependent helicase [Thermoanaerobaculales bacterium]HQN96591.1 ATP-dependent helicase [Thermoanaerobaculales bacterium]HQP43729.1 ATP-dependent helicase [Thermoanaerobaculales bacterium]